MLAALMAGPVDEAAPSALSLAFEGCSDVEAKEIEDVVRADITWAPGDPSIALTLRCQAAGVLLSLLVDETLTEERFVDLAQTAPQARIRTVALIATELVLVGRSAPPQVPLSHPHDSPGASSPGTDAASATSSSPASISAQAGDVAPARPVAILVAAGASLHAAVPGASLFELGGRLRGDLSSRAAIALDLAGLYERRHTASGALMATGGAAELMAEARVRLPGGALRAGLGGSVLVLRVSGSTTMAELRPTAAWGAAVGPVARLAGALEWERAVAELALEGGWCGPEVVGTDHGASGIGVGGWWGGLSLAAGWRVGRKGDRAAVSPEE